MLSMTHLILERKSSRMAEALKMLETAHEKAPKDALIVRNLASAYEKAGKTQEAIAAYEKVLGLKMDAQSRAKVEAALGKLRGE